MRRVAAICEEERLDARGADRRFHDAIELRARRVLVAVAENGENRAANAGEVRRDVPSAEGGIEPDVVPAVEGRVHVVVVAPELLAPARRLVQRARLADRREDRKSTRLNSSHTV